MPEQVPINLVKPPAPEPQRVTLSRSRGWSMPANTIKVDRSTPFGNPFRLGDKIDGEHLDTMEKVLDAYKAFAIAHCCEPAWQRLKGMNLGCWCKPGELCHADVLLKLMNPKLAKK